MIDALALLTAVGWMLAAAFAMAWWQERDRRLHAEGARFHKFTATKLRPDSGSDADAQRQIREAEIEVAAGKLVKTARLGGRVIDPEDARKEAARLIAEAFGTG